MSTDAENFLFTDEVCVLGYLEAYCRGSVQSYGNDEEEEVFSVYNVGLVRLIFRIHFQWRVLPVASSPVSRFPWHFR